MDLTGPNHLVRQPQEKDIVLLWNLGIQLNKYAGLLKGHPNLGRGMSWRKTQQWANFLTFKNGSRTGKLVIKALQRHKAQLW